MGVPNGDAFETNFINGERNIFRQSWQRRADASLVKDLPIHDQYTLHYTFDVYNITNTTSFDIPQNNVNQNAGLQQRSGLCQLDFGCPAHRVGHEQRHYPVDSTTAPSAWASPSTPSAAPARFRCRCTWISDSGSFASDRRRLPTEPPLVLRTKRACGLQLIPDCGSSPIPVEFLDRAMWRFLKGKRHLTASVPLYTNWRTAIGVGGGQVDALKCRFSQENGASHILGFLT